MRTEKTEAPQEQLSNEARQAIRFVNFIARSIPEEKKYLFTRDAQSALLGFMLGIRPAVLVKFPLEDPVAVEDYLKTEGKNAFVYQNSMVIDRAAVETRISEDVEFAEALGWKKGMTTDEWVKQANPSGNERQRGIVGFFLGFPKSAILAYTNNGISEVGGVDIKGPYGGRVMYFTTDAKLVDAPDVKALTEKASTTFNTAGFQNI